MENLVYNQTTPVGWPYIDPSELDSIDVETFEYQRTDREKIRINYESNTWYNWLLESIGMAKETVQSESTLKLLQMRWSIDTKWESLAKRVQVLAQTISSTDDAKESTDSIEKYEIIIDEITSLNFLVSEIKKMLNDIKGNSTVAELLTSDKIGINGVKGGEGTSSNSEADVTSSISGADYMYQFMTSVEETENETRTDWVWDKTYNNVLGGTDTMTVKYNTTSIDTLIAVINKYETWLSEKLKLVNSLTQYDDYEGYYPRGQVSGKRTDRLKQFQKDAYMLDAMLNTNNTCSVWVYLQIGNIKFSTWDDTNFIVDFNYKKNGSSSANAFTFNLAYVPPPGDQNINILEKIIQKRKVFFQYGYNETQIYSPQYTGEIISYSVKVENNVMRYTLTGYSYLVDSRNMKIDLQKNGEQDSSGNVLLGQKATMYAEEVLSTYLSPYGYKIEVSEEVKNFREKKEAVTVFSKFEQTPLFEVVDSILSNVKVKGESSNATVSAEDTENESEDNDSDDSETSETSTESEDAEDVSDSYLGELPHIEYVVDDIIDTDGMKTVTLIYVPSLSDIESSDDITPSLAFAWGGYFNETLVEITDAGTSTQINSTQTNSTQEGIQGAKKENNDKINDGKTEEDYLKILDSSSLMSYTKGTFQMLSNLIISFSTEYKGEVTIAQSYQQSRQQKRYDSDGNLITSYAIDSRFIAGDTVISDEKYQYYLWEKNTLFSYDATLTMIGIPSDIPIGTYLYISPLINGVEHHTSGFYFVSGSDDTISSGNYRTTLKLTKIIDKDADITLSTIAGLRQKKSLYELELPTRLKQANSQMVSALNRARSQLREQLATGEDYKSETKQGYYTENDGEYSGGGRTF